ncbi:hypothetical protein J2Z53_000810 [Clostridium moniliforme]|uniref:Uncharacterized protein n=1 Tax=Clostridium moniliforme TaxID=39489 RepID=A0ABS4EZ11_9CLOT|nr:hypothetical protein [Clostridium moniliforme]
MVKWLKDMCNRGVFFREKSNSVFRDEKLIKMWIISEMN